jgi:starch synthase
MSLKIFYIALECKPFSQVGGVGDVAGELPWALHQRGLQVEILTPLYASSNLHNLVISHSRTFVFQFEGKKERAEIFSGYVDALPIHFIANERYLEGVYGQPYILSSDIPYLDDAIRFSFFSEACLHFITQETPDIVHVNDWGLSFVLGRMAQRNMPQKRVMTVHNIGYQGNIGKDIIQTRQMATFLKDDTTCGSFLDPRPQWASINPLKMGLELAHMVNTVSQGYCWEIRQPEDPHRFFLGGQGLEATTQMLWEQGRLLGIRNGFTYSFEPTEKRFLDILQKKAACKKKITSQFLKTDGIVLGFVGRAVEQKCRLLTEDLEGKSVLRHILDIPGVSVAVLTQGDPIYEQFFMQHNNRNNCWVNIAFDQELASLIQLGCDVFLMPSLFEPCGVAQMASMALATPALVRWTGGLTDTVIPYTSDKGTGFGFDGTNQKKLLQALLHTVQDLAAFYRQRHEAFATVQKNAFNQRFLWSHAAKAYTQAYQKASSVVVD